MRNLHIPVDEYSKEIAGKFNPKHFDAEKWVKTAKDAGMKYLVMTTKHHDGFALFDSDVSDYNIVDALLTIKPQFDCIPIIVEDGEDEYFDNWKNCFPHPRFKNTGNKVHWKVEIPNTGNYEVMVTASTRSNKNVVSFQAKNKIQIALPNTGGMDIFREIELGVVSLRKGINTLTFTGGKKYEIWDFVRLKKIELRKVN